MIAEDRLNWLKGRQQGIGGSDVSAIVGVNPYKSALDVYHEKVDEITDDNGQSQAAYFGTILEDVVAKETAKRLDIKIQKVNQQLTGDKAYELANIDRAIVNPEISGTVRFKDGRLTTDGIIECKTASQYKASEWGPSQEEEIKQGIEAPVKIPKYYMTQIQWYLHITKAEYCIVAVLIGASDFRLYKVKRNQALIDILIKECSTFWTEYVEKRIEPPATSASDVLKKWRTDDGAFTEANAEDGVALGELRNLEAQIKSLEEQAQMYKERLIQSIGEHKGLTLAGEVVATYATVTSNRFDTTGFKKAHPELAKQFTKASTTRRFSLK